MTVNREIVYPIFFECENRIEDVFWKDVFRDMAYGKSPSGTYLDNGYICCGYTKKKFSFKFKGKSPTKIITEITKLLTTRLGMMTDEERKKKREDFTLVESKIATQRKTWKGIKNKKNYREQLIERYVLRSASQSGVPKRETNKILSTVLTAFALKTISQTDIHYDGCNITNIDGVRFESGKVIFDRDIYNIQVASTTESGNTKKEMSENWPKFLEDLRSIKKSQTGIVEEITSTETKSKAEK